MRYPWDWLKDIDTRKQVGNSSYNGDEREADECRRQPRHVSARSRITEPALLRKLSYVTRKLNEIVELSNVLLCILLFPLE